MRKKRKKKGAGWKDKYASLLKVLGASAAFLLFAISTYYMGFFVPFFTLWIIVCAAFCVSILTQAIKMRMLHALGLTAVAYAAILSVGIAVFHVNLLAMAIIMFVLNFVVVIIWQLTLSTEEIWAFENGEKVEAVSSSDRVAAQGTKGLPEEEGPVTSYAERLFVGIFILFTLSLFVATFTLDDCLYGYCLVYAFDALGIYTASRQIMHRSFGVTLGITCFYFAAVFFIGIFLLHLPTLYVTDGSLIPVFIFLFLSEAFAKASRKSPHTSPKKATGKKTM